MATLRRFRNVLAAALALGLVALGATDAHATHFRYGTLRWEKVSEDATNVTIKITSESAWRFSYPAWPSTPTFGVPMSTGQQLMVLSFAGGPTVFNGPLVITPSAINGPGGEDWFVGSSEDTITFPKARLPVRIFWEGNARISTLQDQNNDQFFRVESVMTATNNAASPAASILPIITLGWPLPAAHFFIPAGDVEGDTLTWSIATIARSRLSKAAPDGFPDPVPPAPSIPTLSINSATGEVKWNTAAERTPGALTELYAVQFLVRDSKGAETPVDALLRLRPTVGTPPEARINGLVTPHAVSVRPNNPVSFTLTGVDVDAGATVTLTSGNIPVGASMTPSLPTSGTGGGAGTSSVFNWTPTLADAGNVFPVSFAVTDNLGNQSQNSAQITVLENFAPSVTCPAAAILEATGPSGASTTSQALVSDPDGDGLTVRWFVDGTLVETDTVPPAPPIPATVVDLTRAYGFLPAPHALRVEVSDALLTRECISTVLVRDTTPPVISGMPANITEEATGPSGAPASWASPTALDVVDLVRPVICTPASGSTFPLGVTTVSCSASDTRGNTATETFTVTVRDTTPPVISGMPANMIKEATGPSGAPANWPPPTAFDIVDLVRPVICTPASGSTFPLGVTTVSCSASDTRGNTTTETFTVTVQDTTPPDISGMPANMIKEATGPSGAPATWPPPTAFDLVDLVRPVVCTPASGSTFPIGLTTVSCSASDTRGNTRTETFTVTVQDTTPPVISGMPANMIKEATGPSGAPATWPLPTAFDLVDLVRTVVCTPASGSTFPLGVTTVGCSASDTRGNTRTETFTVTVQDTTPPVISGMPANMIKEATGPSGAPATWPLPTAFDLVDLVRTVVCTPASGSTFPLGVTTVGCSASDTRGNTRTETFTVTVRDTTPPALTLPADMTVPATGPTGAVVTFTATAVDLVDGSVPVACIPPSGSLFPLGSTTVNCHATDAHNNRADGHFVVRVVDVTPPVVTVKLNPGVLWPPNHKMVDIKVTVTTSDTDPNPVCRITTVTSSEPVDGNGDGSTPFDWLFSGLSLQLRAERSGMGPRGAVGRIYTVKVSCTDREGNVGFGTATAVVPHDMRKTQ